MLDVVGKAKRGVTGTRIRYWADRQIFTPDAKFSYEDLAARARQTSFLVPGLKLTVRDERKLAGTPGEMGPHEEVFHHDGGISEFVDFLAADPAVTDIWRLHGAGKFKETVPVLDEKGHSQLAEVERDCEVDVALRWGIGYDSTVRSFVNIISTPKGGTHQSGFEQALLKTFRKAVETNARKLKAGNDKIEKDDIFAGLTAVLTVRLAEPQFEGQTKEILGTSAVRAIVAKVVEQEITAKLTSRKPQRQGPVGAAAGKDRQRDEVAHLGARPQGDPAPQERAGDLLDAHQARRLPHRRRRPLRTVHRRRRLRARHRQAGAVLRLPGAAAHPRQDPQRPEGLGGGHALQRRVRGPDPGGGGRLRAARSTSAPPGTAR